MIDEKKIWSLLEETKDPKKSEVEKIIEKTADFKPLELREVALLLNCEDAGLIAEIKAAARLVKEKIYGRRMVLFAPLYMSSECVNNCLYCGFKRSNRDISRKTLSLDEIARETLSILKSGHKRILLVAGEDLKKCSIDYIVEAIKTIYKVDYKGNKIRRVNVNLAPCEVGDLKKLHSADIGTFQLFQEVFHRETYAKLHTAGPKKDIDKRLALFPKAFEAGIDDVGIGVLYGLYDYKFETLALLTYAKFLDEKFHVGPHTISVPRLEPAAGCDFNGQSQYLVPDGDFKKVVAILRLAVPYTGIILSTRESAKLREELVELGVSQLSAGSKTEPGGYSRPEEATGQFVVSDERSLDEVIHQLAEKGFLPSFCTSCYRSLRTGESFMALSKTGHIHEFCDINGLITFYEYLIDFASPETKETGFKLIDELKKRILPEDKQRDFETYIKRLESGERDVFV
jgi:2-iminoacetate synthase